MNREQREKIAINAANTWCRCFKCDGKVNATGCACEKDKLLTCRKWYDGYRTAMLALEEAEATSKVSNDLEEAAQEYTEKGSKCQEELDAFKDGAKWQKEKLMAKAVDVTIAIPYQNGYGGYTQLVDSKDGLPFGENLKVLVIKKEIEL